jgi:hypothetical protein
MDGLREELVEHIHVLVIYGFCFEDLGLGDFRSSMIAPFHGARSGLHNKAVLAGKFGTNGLFNGRKRRRENQWL